MDAHIHYVSLGKGLSSYPVYEKPDELKEVFDNFLSGVIDYSYITDFFKLWSLWDKDERLDERRAIEAQMIKALSHVSYRKLIDYLRECRSETNPEALVVTQMTQLLCGFHFEDLFALWKEFSEVPKSRELISCQVMNLLGRVRKEKTNIVLLKDFLRVIKIDAIPEQLIPAFKEKVGELQ